MPRTVGRKRASGRQRGSEDGKERVYYSTRAQIKELEKLIAEKEEEVWTANASRAAADVSRRSSSQLGGESGMQLRPPDPGGTIIVVRTSIVETSSR